MKPEKRSATRGLQETRAALWKAIRKLGRFTAADLRAATGTGESTARAYLKGLIAARYLTDVGGDATGGRIYRLVCDAVDAPRIRKDGTEVTMGKGRNSLWRAMKILKTFTVTDLVACAPHDPAGEAGLRPESEESSVEAVRRGSGGGRGERGDGRGERGDGR
jgi:hypothetical protein